MGFVCFITPFIRCLLSPHEPALSGEHRETAVLLGFRVCG